MNFDVDTFTKNDWSHMHDCVMEASWDQTPEGNLRRTHLDEIQLKTLFLSLPDDMKQDAHKYGMNDTAWRENFIAYYKYCVLNEI